MRTVESNRRRTLFGLVLSFVSTSGCAGVPQVIQLSDPFRAATEELEVHLPRLLSGAVWSYRFGEFAVSSVEGGSVSEEERSSGFFNRTTTNETAELFQYSMTGSDSTAVEVRAAISTGVEIDEPLTLGFGDDGGISRDEDVREIVRTTTAQLVFEGDSAAAWELSIVERYVSDGWTFDATVTSGTRMIQLVPVNSDGPLVDGPDVDMLGRRGHGYLLEEEGRAIAAVQYRGSGLGSTNAMKVWLPLDAPSRERLEWAAILAAVMASEHKRDMVGN